MLSLGNGFVFTVFKFTVVVALCWLKHAIVCVSIITLTLYITCQHTQSLAHM